MPFLLEERKPFSQSLLWALQSNYYREMGFEAWRNGEVPYYVTNNQRFANSYAEIIFAFLETAYRSAANTCKTFKPLQIIETGAGTGRFAFYLVSRLSSLCEAAAMPGNVFRYILSDFTQANLDFWRVHPCLIDFFEKGCMDIALFDMNDPNSIQQQLTGTTLCREDSDLPLVLIANYVFDSIPQDLFYTTEKSCDPCVVSLRSEEDPNNITTAGLLEKLSIQYEVIDAAGQKIYTESYLEQLLRHYRGADEGAYVFFPATAIRALEYLRNYLPGGLCVLTADKGEHLPELVQYGNTPKIITHGSFSLNVNYHAIKSYCEQQGGQTLFPSHSYTVINIGCLLMTNDAFDTTSMISAYDTHVNLSGPDDYFSLFKSMRSHLPVLQLNEMLSMLRVFLYDSEVLVNCMPRLMEMAAELDLYQKQELVVAVKNCWENYYPIGESNDLAGSIGSLMYKIGAYTLAVHYFTLSEAIYGSDTGTLYNMAACYKEMGRYETAAQILEKIILADASNEAAVLLLNTCKLRKPNS